MNSIGARLGAYGRITAVLNSSKAAASSTDKVANEELRRWLENLNDEDLGRYKM